jgi:hypothetical protein
MEFYSFSGSFWSWILYTTDVGGFQERVVCPLVDKFQRDDINSRHEMASLRSISPTQDPLL